jgi:hyperosmotically inducible periplasmic protein
MKVSRIGATIVALSPLGAAPAWAQMTPATQNQPPAMEKVPAQFTIPDAKAIQGTEGTITKGGKTATREGTDSGLTFKTKLALLADERVSSNDVSVKTVKGVITLHGKVASPADQQAAEEIARMIEGQKKVVNQLTVVPTAQRKIVDRQDDQIVTDVKEAITTEASLKKASIDVRAEKGIVTLTGKAPSLVTSVRASEVARRVAGVRAVRNELAS